MPFFWCFTLYSLDYHHSARGAGSSPQNARFIFRLWLRSPSFFNISCALSKFSLRRLAGAYLVDFASIAKMSVVERIGKDKRTSVSVESLDRSGEWIPDCAKKFEMSSRRELFFASVKAYANNHASFFLSTTISFCPHSLIYPTGAR